MNELELKAIFAIRGSDVFEMLATKSDEDNLAGLMARFASEVNADLLAEVERLRGYTYDKDGKPLTADAKTYLLESFGKDNEKLLAENERLRKAINSVLPHFESHQIYDKGSEVILRAALGDNG